MDIKEIGDIAGSIMGVGPSVSGGSGSLGTPSRGSSSQMRSFMEATEQIFKIPKNLPRKRLANSHTVSTGTASIPDLATALTRLNDCIQEWMAI